MYSLNLLVKKALLAELLLFFLLSNFLVAQETTSDLSENISKATQVSIVFASENMQSPISSFGHTFLVFHRHKIPQPNDIVLEFVMKSSSSLNMLKSLFWRAPGAYKFSRFYDKEKEYAKEDRGLWIMKLKLSLAEMRRLKEISLKQLKLEKPYNFFTKNCSSYIYQLLNSSFNEKCSYSKQYTIPIETIDQLSACDRLESTYSYKEALSKKYNKQRKKITHEEKKIKKDLLSINPSSLAKMSMNLQRLISLELDYLIPREREKYKRDHYFKLKKNMHFVPSPVYKEKRTPAHTLSQSIFTIGFNDNSSLSLGYAIALQSPARRAQSTKYWGDSLSFTDISINTKVEQLSLEHFYLLRLLSRQADGDLSKGFTREFSLGFDRKKYILPGYKQIAATLGFGKSYEVGSLKLSLLYRGLWGRFFTLNHRSSGLSHGPKIFLDLKIKDLMLFQVEYQYYMAHRAFLEIEWHAHAYLYLKPNHSISAHWGEIDRNNRFSLDYHFTF